MAPAVQLIKCLDGTKVECKEAVSPPSQNHWLWTVPCVQYLVRDQRDLPLAMLTVNAALILMPFAAMVWISKSHMLGAMYNIVLLVGFFGRFMSMLHEFVHVRLFRSRLFGFVFVTCILGALHGVPFGTYHIHHALMHHHGGNRWGIDLSSTERYDRTSIFHLVLYWLRHYTPPGIVYDMIATCMRYRRYRMGIAYAFATISWFGLMVKDGGCTPGILWTMIVPTFLSGVAGAWAGWAQHLFLTPHAPRKWYSFEIINSIANTHHFNAGFHATHHDDASVHWTEMPQAFIRNLDRYRDAGIFIFQGIDNPTVLWWVLRGRFDILAEHLVGFEKLTRSEAIARMRAQLQPLILR